MSIYFSFSILMTYAHTVQIIDDYSNEFFVLSFYIFHIFSSCFLYGGFSFFPVFDCSSGIRASQCTWNICRRKFKLEISRQITSELLVATLERPGDIAPVVGSGLAATWLPSGNTVGPCGYEARWGCCGFGWCTVGPGGALCTIIGADVGTPSTEFLPRTFPSPALIVPLPRNDSWRYCRTWFFCFWTTW